MGDEAKIVRDLRATSAKYAESAKGDILNALRQYKDLKSDVELFMYPDGKKRQAFKLVGTIPVSYKGAVYNIPVSIYLWDTHPYYAPICCVNPTPTMVIKESEHVNKQGRVFLPYLNEWRYPGYDLYGLIQMMVMIFQDRCPLYSKGSAESSRTSSSNSTPQPLQPQSHSSPAMPTPYPSDNALPYPTTTAGGVPYPTSSSSTPYPNPYPSNMGTGYGMPQPPPTRPAPPTDAIRMSLISTVEDKLRAKLRDKLGTTYAEMASMRQTQTELKAGQQKIKVAMESLERQSRELDAFNGAYTEKKADLERILKDHDSSDGAQQPMVDDAVEAASPLDRQLLEAYAADLSCDDAYYALGQALKSSHIPVADYLRNIRDISRRQFEHRATMRKCRVAAGLPT